MLFYGTNTPDKVIPVGSLNAREPFINTYNSYNVLTVALANQGTGYLTSDIGKICTVNLTGGTQIRPLSVIINSVVAGAITSVSIIDFGAWTNPPSVLTGNLVFPATQPSPGSGAAVFTTFALYPTIEAYPQEVNAVGGGGLFVGDATSGTTETVRVTGSLAPQDYTNVNITGGSISNVTLNSVNMISGATTPSVLTNVTLREPIVRGASIGTDTTVTPNIPTTITAATITGGTIDLSSTGNLKVKNTGFPSGVTGVGVLVLGSDGNVYVTNNLDANTIATLQTASYVKVGGGLAVGSAVVAANVAAGAVRASGDLIAKATS